MIPWMPPVRLLKLPANVEGQRTQVLALAVCASLRPGATSRDASTTSCGVAVQAARGLYWLVTFLPEPGRSADAHLRGDRVKSIMERLKMPDGEAIEASIVTRSIESAQRKYRRNFDVRKQLLEYDVANDQEVIYQQHNDIMDATTWRLHHYVRAVVDAPVQCPLKAWKNNGMCPGWKGAAGRWQIDCRWLLELSPPPPSPTKRWLKGVVAAAHAASMPRSTIGEENFIQFERVVLLHRHHWREHLSAGLSAPGHSPAGYAQKSKQEYKRPFI
jgi:preprotein translocase subunit SecA